MRKTAIVRDERYLDHQPGRWHPESPERLKAIYSMLNGEDMEGIFVDLPARRATRDELLRIHSAGYVDRILATAGKGYRSLDPDTAVSEGSCEAALLAAGGVCEAVSAVVFGEMDNAFALVRPPGHHAEQTQAMGFCLFNNLAIGARHAQALHGIERVLVVDWDLHHGNGTQHSFEDDPSVLYFSTHQYPYYPGSGASEQIGRGSGDGFTVNVPLSSGKSDAEYAAVFDRILRPIALSFAPELILVSAGFDIHENDPLGGMRVTSQGFGRLTRTVMEIADACCSGKVVMTLEGGYDLKGLGSSVKAVIREMAGVSGPLPEPVLTRSEEKAVERIVATAARVHGAFWRDLTLKGAG
jgi:acetoin utilization deacetylase AcuC-like enzyme